MDDANLILFLTASVIVILAPGPDNILVLTRGVTLGRKAALISASARARGLFATLFSRRPDSRRSFSNRRWPTPW